MAGFIISKLSYWISTTCIHHHHMMHKLSCWISKIKTMYAEKQKRDSSSSAATGYFIPEELILSEILPRLPYKSFCRFRCVCKKWNDVTFLPKYGLVTVVKDKMLMYTITTSGVSICKSYPTSFLSNDDYRARLINSTNGLLCLELENKTINHRFLYVNNPLTNASQVIPDSSNCVVHFPVALAFDPQILLADFKLIHPFKLRVNESTRNCQIVDFGFKIFSSTTSKWVSAGAKVTVKNFIKLGKSVYVKGVIYWDSCYELMSFNLKKDAATNIILPIERDDLFENHEMGVCKDQLTYMKICSFCVQVWLLSSKGNWEQMCKVWITEMVADNGDFFPSLGLRLLRKKDMADGLTYKCTLLPLPFVGGEKLYMRVRPYDHNEETGRPDSHHEETVISYDIKTGEVSRLCTVNIENCCIDWILSYDT